MTNVIIIDKKIIDEYSYLYSNEVICELIDKYNDGSILCLINSEHGKLYHYATKNEYKITNKHPPKHFSWKCNKCQTSRLSKFNNLDVCYVCGSNKLIKHYD